MSHGAFTNDRFEFQDTTKSPDARIAPPVIAQVTEVLSKFRANILTTFGEPFKNVRYFGPHLQPGGRAHGRAFGVKKDQWVLVEFIGGSYRAPIITKVFSFATKDSDLSNIDDFWDKYSFIDPETDIIDFHESGFLVRQTTDKVQVYDADQAIVLEMDFLTKKMKLTFDQIELNGQVEINGDTTIHGKTTIDGDTEITGDTDLTGQLHVSDTTTLDGDLLIEGQPYEEHGHSYNPGPLAPVKSGPPI